MYSFPSFQAVVLEFEDFDIQYDPECLVDAVVIFSGDVIDVSQLMYFLCGSGSVEAIVSVEYALVVYLHANSQSVGYTGFHATFTSEHPEDRGKLNEKVSTFIWNFNYFNLEIVLFNI